MKQLRLTKWTKIGAGLLAILLVAIIYRCGLQKVCHVAIVEQTVREQKILALPKGIITAEVVDTPESRNRGLSGRSELKENEGMLFVFDHSGRYGFWMKDMLFAIDMVWINEDGVVVHVEHHVSPDSYFKEHPPKTFINTPDALYVLELAAGQAEKHGLYLGTKVTFK